MPFLCIVAGLVACSLSGSLHKRAQVKRPTQLRSSYEAQEPKTVPLVHIQQENAVGGGRPYKLLPDTNTRHTASSFAQVANR